MLGLLGAALFYGDAIITPAISVLSAVEGLKLVTPGLRRPTSCRSPSRSSSALFLVQSRGTGKVASLLRADHGRVRSLTIGARRPCPTSSRSPASSGPSTPITRVHYLLEPRPRGALVALGAVFLAVTGAEALFADLGHFGRRPIQRRLARPRLPLPDAELSRPGARSCCTNPTPTDPFFRSCPNGACCRWCSSPPPRPSSPSQAVITGAFSLSRQAVQLGLLPRLEIRHTSESHSGQIYLPQINALLLVGVVILAVLFRSSSGARLGLRHRRDRHDADHREPRLPRARAKSGAGRPGPPALAILPFVVDRALLPAVEPAQGVRGRLRAPAARGRPRRHDVDLGAGRRASCSTRPARPTCRSTSSSACWSRARRTTCAARRCS